MSFESNGSIRSYLSAALPAEGWRPAGGERRIMAGSLCVRARFGTGQLASAYGDSFVEAPEGAAATLDLVAVDDSCGPLPRPGWSWEARGARGLIALTAEPGACAAYHAGVETFSIHDAASSRALYHIPDGARAPHYQVSSPFLHILHWTLAQHERWVMHAAAFGDARGIVLAIGRGGSGKSSTAVAAALAGLRFHGDDYCAVDAGRLEVHTLYATAKLFPADAERFPQLQALERTVPLPGEKQVFDMRGFVQREPGRLRGLLLPVTTSGTKSWLEPARPGEALRALAPSTMLQLSTAGAADLRAMGRVARELPALRLCLGRDPGGVLRAIDDALSRVA